MLGYLMLRCWLWLGVEGVVVGEDGLEGYWGGVRVGWCDWDGFDLGLEC